MGLQFVLLVLWWAKVSPFFYNHISNVRIWFTLGGDNEYMTTEHDYRTRHIIVERTTAPLYPTVSPCYNAWEVWWNKCFFYFQCFDIWWAFEGCNHIVSWESMCILNLTRFFLTGMSLYPYILFVILCVWVWGHFVCKCVSVLNTLRGRRGHQLRWAGDSSCELPCGGWGPNPGPPEEQQHSYPLGHGFSL